MLIKLEARKEPDKRIRQEKMSFCSVSASFMTLPSFSPPIFHNIIK